MEQQQKEKHKIFGIFIIGHDVDPNKPMPKIQSYWDRLRSPTALQNDKRWEQETTIRLHSMISVITYMSAGLIHIIKLQREAV